MQYRLQCACHRIVPLVINGKHPHKLLSEPLDGDHGPKSIAELWSRSPSNFGRLELEPYNF